MENKRNYKTVNCDGWDDSTNKPCKAKIDVNLAIENKDFEEVIVNGEEYLVLFCSICGQEIKIRKL